MDTPSFPQSKYHVGVWVPTFRKSLAEARGRGQPPLGTLCQELCQELAEDEHSIPPQTGLWG